MYDIKNILRSWRGITTIIYGAVVLDHKKVIAVELVRVVMVTSHAAEMKGLAGSVNWLG